MRLFGSNQGPPLNAGDGRDRPNQGQGQDQASSGKPGLRHAGEGVEMQ